MAAGSIRSALLQLACACGNRTGRDHLDTPILSVACSVASMAHLYNISAPTVSGIVALHLTGPA